MRGCCGAAVLVGAVVDEGSVTALVVAPAYVVLVGDSLVGVVDPGSTVVVVPTAPTARRRPPLRSTDATTSASPRPTTDASAATRIP